MNQSRWPTSTALESMGLVRCHAEGCTTYRDPVNTRGIYCKRHRFRRTQRAASAHPRAT